MEKNITVRLTARLFAEEKCYGPGVEQLLKAVEKHRSLRAAAASMSMAYSKACCTPPSAAAAEAAQS